MRLIDAIALQEDYKKEYGGKRLLLIDVAPTVDAAPVVHGRWKRKIVDCGFNADWVCSQCGYRVMTDFVNYKYCPGCGATMDR